MVLDSKVKAKWTRALRSGKYRRAKHQLKDNGAYCCLGVLCEVMGWKYSNSDTNLHEGLRKQVGLTPQAEAALIDLNDGGWDDIDEERFGDAPKGYRPTGASFKVIADWISKHA